MGAAATNNNTSLPATVPRLPTTSTIPPFRLSTSPPAQQFRIHDDELGKKIRMAVHEFQRSNSWETFATAQRGSAPDIAPNVRHLAHPAAHLLDHLRNHGAPIPMSTLPWNTQRRDDAVARGPHKSAKDEVSFVREEFTDFLNKKFWTILPYRLVRHLQNLRLSPLGVVPQRDRRPRLIVDLSFFGINQESVPIAPSDSMQFGRALHRILQRILQANPLHGPVYISKIDIADGFYRIQLAPYAVPHLAVLLPQHPNEEAMVAFPLVLPMGWVNSPPYFSAVTETGADLMNRRLKQRPQEPPHRLEELALFPPALEKPASSLPPTTHRVDDPIATPPSKPIHQPRFRRPMRYADVYVDDFISLVQGTENDRRQAMRTLLHVLDSVFRPRDSTGDSPFRQEPASVKKLKKGDASWSTKKVVLGWLLDSVDKTISLPPHRIERLQTILAGIGPTKKRISAKNWHRLLGELRSMVIGIPGARGLFSPLQEAFRTETPDHRLRLNAMVHQFLDDFRQLSTTLGDRPTRIAELIPQDPSVIGTTDASGTGMGGVAFLNTPSGLRPILWRHRYPKHVQSKLITFDNPRGSLSIGDLELSATVCQHDVVTTAADAREHTIHSFHDNTAAQFWQRKGSTTTTGPAAALLRLQSHHQRVFRYVPFHDYLPGLLNKMNELLGAAPRSAADSFRRDLDISQQTVRKGVVRGTQDTADAHWELWTKFCEELGLDPLLRVPDPVQFLQVFATRYRRRPGKYPGECVRSGTVSNAIRSVGQTMASMGARDARKDSTGSIDFRLTRMFKAYTREDPPPHRVKPIPVGIIKYIANQSRNQPCKVQAISDMIIVAFFFLLRPGEYTGTTNDDTPFRFLDVQLKVGVRHLDLLTTTPAELWAATSVALTFTTQKNGVRGEVICHGRSGHDVLCPVRSMICRILHLRQHTANMHTIIATYFQNGRHYSVKSADITTTLRQATAACGADLGFLPSDVSARSLRAGGAMALFCSNVDRDTIQLIGRWKSDAMLRYLHVQAQPVMQGFASMMLHGGDYAIHPGQNLVPMY